MNLAERAAVHAALGEPVRLALADSLIPGDASPSDLAESLDLGTNLLAHHLKVLEAAGVTREDLHLAWDLTVASRDSLTGRARHLRDETFAALGDTDLDDGVVDGAAPAFTVDEVEERLGDLGGDTRDGHADEQH